MTYLTDNPWPLILFFAAVAVVAVLSGHRQGKAIGLVAVLLAVGVYFLEKQLVSEAEKLELVVVQLLDDFKTRDIKKIQSHISADRPDLVDLAKSGLDLVRLDDNFSVKSATVEFQGEDTASVLIRANGSVTLKTGGSGSRHVPTYWKTIWKNQSGWKLTEVTRLNPANGTEMGTLDSN